ncbi:putative pentatricopeptide repeat-containing protein at3g25970 [Phtheirospermum japonicum]|uniref:Putative pentatricopeptide repeat-containing protein at3g25970 n=1 Tax=Phtheirospermum japonicum TaxID=374723 RepID=A0A830CP16_9LAMI|nr:putative pentatricopeptide repeat-containing protein at3g25970 [Phtheirospermum japonicum]
MRPLLLNRNTLPTLSAVVATHCQSIKLSLLTDTYTSNNLISSYAKCKDLNSALKVFDEMPYRDTASWNTIITAHINSGAFPIAWKVLKSMKNQGFSFDGYTFGSTLKGIAINSSLVHGQQVHSDIVKMGLDYNVYAASALLDMYAKCNKVEDAHKVFDHMPERNTVSWNALIAGYAETSNLNRCVGLFSRMELENVRVDDATFAPLLTLLRDVELYGLTRQLHGKIMKRGLHLENTVLNATITAYADCGCIEDAKRVFDNGDGYRDVVTWNSILAACLERDLDERGFDIFLEMMRFGLEMDVYTYSCIISACFGNAQIRLGKSLHGLVIKRGLERVTEISNVLISMYLKSNSQSVDDSLRIFEKIDIKDLVSWNTILTGLSQIGLSENTLRLFQYMRLDYLVIDQYAFAAALKSCSDLAMLGLGRQVHVLVVKSGSEGNEYVASALIFMYSKCGIIEDSLKAFESSRKESSVTWNAVIFAYAQHGQGKIALNLFDEMTVRKIKLDHITFVAALTACSHVGFVDEGLKILKSMETEYNIPARMENYACAIDLLGRAGRLTEAKVLINEMTFEPDLMVWKTLLGACRACGDIQLATQVAAHLLEMDPGDHCTYVILSDMYGKLKRWDEKARVKRLMRVKGVKKVPGWSWIELGNDVHAFNANDHSHPKCREIYGALEELTGEIRICDRDLGLDVGLDDVDLVRGCWVVGYDGLVESAVLT